MDDSGSIITLDRHSFLGTLAPERQNHSGF